MSCRSPLGLSPNARPGRVPCPARRRWRPRLGHGGRLALAGSLLLLSLSARAADSATPAAAAAVGAATPPPASVAGPVTVTRGDLAQYTPAIGTFRACQVTQIKPEISGLVLEVLVDIGDTVSKGQDLVRIDPTLFEVDRDRRLAELASAKIGVEQAELAYKRMKGLWEKPQGETPSVPQKLYDDARLAMAAAEAHVKKVEVDLREAQEELRRTVLHAPYDGVVMSRTVEPGSYVMSMEMGGPGGGLLQIQTMRPIELEFLLPQPLLSSVRVGTPVRFTVEGVSDEPERAAVGMIYPAADEATRSFRCRAVVPNEAGRYRPGLMASVQVLAAEAKGVLILPPAAVTRNGHGVSVLVADSGDPSGTRRPVRTGLTTADGVEIVDGVKEGETVLIPEGR